MDHYTKGKVKIQKEITRLNRKLKIMGLYIQEMQDLDEYIDPKMREDVKEIVKDIALLNRRLKCKHHTTRKEEFESHHNGDISTSVYCIHCELLMEHY